MMMEWLKSAHCTVDVVSDYETLSHKAASIVIASLSAALEQRTSVVLVPSAGKTPTELYRILVSQYYDAIEWGRVTIFQMDEYLGMPNVHPNSMANYLEENFVAPLGIGKFITLNDRNGDLILSPLEYQAKLNEEGGIDIVIHGLGRNGHIGFNEPGSDWLSETRIAQLDQSTLEANFSGQNTYLREQFSRGVTLGLGCLTQARHAILLISGDEKKEVTKKLLHDKPDIRIPASSLCMNNKVHIIINNNQFGPTFL